MEPLLGSAHRLPHSVSESLVQVAGGLLCQLTGIHRDPGRPRRFERGD